MHSVPFVLQNKLDASSSFAILGDSLKFETGEGFYYIKVLLNFILTVVEHSDNLTTGNIHRDYTLMV